jgi:tRNA1(Val) A37 N6-methylase TrmN6
VREQIGSLTLLQSPNQFRLTRDALALADFATLHNGDRVCDLGCGVGNLLIPLAARAEHLTLDGVELQPEAAQLCRENLRYNALRGEIVTGDLNVRHEALPWGGYDLVVANPPYFPQGQGKVSSEAARRLARQEADYTLEKACQAAAHLCKNGGNFALCLRPERLAELFAALQKARLEPKRLQLLQSAPEREANLALVEARRGGKSGLRVLPMKIVR